MVAKTFDLDDPAQYLAYLEESETQMLLYGDVRLTFGMGRSITVHDVRDPVYPASQPGFRMVTDDGHVLPVPSPEAGR